MSNNDSSSTIIIINITSTTAAPSPYALTWDEQNMLGYFCMGIILVCSIAYVPVLFIFKRNSHFNRHLSYRIMYHIGLLELFYLWTYFFLCLMIVMHTDFGAIFGRGLFSVRNAIYWTMNVLTTILALNRSDAICNFLPYLLRKNNLLFVILLVLCYISTFLLAIMYLIPGFQAEIRGLTTIRDVYNKLYLYPIILFSSFGMFIFSYILYLFAGIKLVMMRCKTSNNQVSINKQELSLFIQSFVICGYKSGMIFMWTYGAPTTKLFFFIFYFLSIFEIGYPPFMYYLMNRTLRREIHVLLNVHRSTTKVQTIQSVHSNKTVVRSIK